MAGGARGTRRAGRGAGGRVSAGARQTGGAQVGGRFLATDGRCRGPAAHVGAAGSPAVCGPGAANQAGLTRVAARPVWSRLDGPWTHAAASSRATSARPPWWSIHDGWELLVVRVERASDATAL